MSNTVTPPEGIVSLVFTDIQGSSASWDALGAGYQLILDQHNALLREEAIRHRGLPVKRTGDGFMLAFQRASDAVAFSVSAQRRLAEADWPPEVGELLVRIGVHTGEPILVMDETGLVDDFGPPVNRAARVADAGHGGQILASATTRELAAQSLGAEYELKPLGSHRLKGLEQPEEVFQVVHPDLPLQQFPAIRTLDRRRHNLPIELTSFVGRDLELASLTELLSDPAARLVTIWGFGGIGKTRLALHVAAELIDRFEDGVYLVELENVRRLEDAVMAILSTLGVSPQPGRDPREQLRSFLAERQLLLVLDSSEQVLGAGQLLNELIRSAPRLTILATSRSVLGVPGERVYQVHGLPVPPARMRGARLTQIAAFPAIALFTERAHAAAPGHELTEANAPAIVELCRRVEGHPLCIELAAARSRGLSPEQILERLKNRFKILASGNPNLPAKLRTLKGTIDVSYNLLNRVEQEFFARLAVFRGGFWMEAAEQITGHPETLDLVLSLQDNSLVSARSVPPRMRYQLLELVRDYAAECLTALEDHETLFEAHARFYCEQLGACVAAERSPREREALVDVLQDVDNCGAALEWARQYDPSVAAPLATAYAHLLSRLGRWRDAREAVMQAIATAQSSKLPAALSDALLEAGCIHYDLGELSDAVAAVEQSLALADEQKVPSRRTSPLNMLGIIAKRRGRYPEARAYYEEARRGWRRASNKVGAGIAAHNLSHLDELEGNLEQAEDGYREVLAVRRRIGDVRGTAETLNNLGNILMKREDFDEAGRCFRESAGLWEELGDDLGTGLARHNLGELRLKQGDLAAAGSELNQALETFLALGSPHAKETRRVLKELGEHHAR